MSRSQASLFDAPAPRPAPGGAAARARVSPAGWRYAVAVDTETSGVCSRSRVVQVAALRFRFRPAAGGGAEVEFSERFRFVGLVRPPEGTPFHPAAVAVTGIGPARVRGAPAFGEISSRVLEVAGDLDLVAHNAPFDRRMLEREFGHAGVESPAPRRWICSLGLAKRAYPGEVCRLGEIAPRLGIRPSGALHDAGTDAELAGRLFAHIEAAATPSPPEPSAAFRR